MPLLCAHVWAFVFWHVGVKIYSFSNIQLCEKPVIYIESVALSQFKNGTCFYIVQYPVQWAAQSALHPWQTCSLRHQLDFFGKHSSQAAITRKDYSLTFPLPSIARYSFIKLSKHGNQLIERKCQNFEMVANG